MDEPLYIGQRLVTPLALRTLSEAEWELGLGLEGVLAPTAEDLLYFRLDGVVHVASFVMDTKLTEVVRQAHLANDLTVGLGDRRGRFLRSEDVESFVNRQGLKRGTP